MNDSRFPLLSRRDFSRMALAASSLMAFSTNDDRTAAQAAAESPQKRNIALGFDNFSVRAFKWNADQLLDYASKLNVDVMLLSDLGVYSSFEEKYLTELKSRSEALNIAIQPGTVSICPTSETFNTKYGTAEEHLSLLIRIAKALGSKVARCYVGHGGDRTREGGIEKHIESAIEVLKKVRSQAVDANVKLAIENHAGDLQAWELAGLVEAAGKDFVGVTMDSGNAVWTIEDPVASLEILGPYAVTTGMRDCSIWKSEKGVSVQWSNMGNGGIDWKAYLDKFEKLCPGVDFILEIISGGPREYPVYDKAFWNAYPKARAKDFARFVASAEKGKPATPPQDRPTGKDAEETSRLQQAYDLEQSLEYCRKVLGLGLK